MFLPTTAQEVKQSGWNQLDIILVTGDSYIDSPYIGTAVIGKVLAQAGYKVGVIAQPDIQSDKDIARLGSPRLFWGVTGGSVDSMVANYTASNRKRKSDDYTPGGANDRRPDRAVIIYANLIRRHFKQTQPIVLGGIEASLRRIAHYDYWSDKVRRSILFDAKADYLLYGMAEKAVVELAQALDAGGDPKSIRGLCYIDRAPNPDHLDLPSHECVENDKRAFIDMFNTFYHNNDPVSARGLNQLHGDRYLIQNPPQKTLYQDELDAIYDLDYEYAQHPYYEKQGKVKALETIKFAISTHRGCYGECNFCAISVHEGRTVTWRSKASVVAEARKRVQDPAFKGYFSDIGGPTANMYGFECTRKLRSGICEHKRCLLPSICPSLPVDHARQIELLTEIRKIKGVKKAFVASGLRYDLILHDRASGVPYCRELVQHHVSGQLKVAPEHSEDRVLKSMGKPSVDPLLKFKQLFDDLNHKFGKEQYLTYYLIAAHPGCQESDMLRLKEFASRKLHIAPEQVQIFTPSPSTYSTLMYYTGIDPFADKEIFVEKDITKKERQKEIVTGKRPEPSKRPSKPAGRNPQQKFHTKAEK